MKHKKTITSVALLLLGLGGLQAQESSTSAGGEATGSGGVVSYSVGQVVYAANSGTNGNSIQGVQQPYEIFTVGISATELNISLSVLPNPTINNLTLKIDDYSNQILKYQLFDMQGKILKNGEITARETEINTFNLFSATYFINVTNQENKIIQSFKIIKK